jgi:hypothetical protein
LIIVPAKTALVLSNISPIETALLGPRLEAIEDAIQNQYQSQISDYETFIFPGAGGVDSLIVELCSVTPKSKIVDWSEHRGNILTAAYDGEAVGQGIANLLLDSNNKKNCRFLHFIGISVGAFAANAAATALYQQRGSDTQVKLTLLDPFCGRGVFGSSYGKHNFGKYASRSIQILNTDDPVPTTNDPLPYCYCLDVTQAPERKAFTPLPGDTMHSWPLAYMARHYQEPSESLMIPGTVVKIA